MKISTSNKTFIPLSLGRLITTLYLFSVLISASQAQPLAIGQINEDSRLEKQISLRFKRVTVTYLLRQISKESNIKIEANIKDLAGSDLVTVAIQDRKVCDVLNSIWSLLSFKKAEWRWSRVKTAGGFEYTLTRPAGARNFTTSLREEIQDDFEKHAQELIDGSDLSADERSKLSPIAQKYLEDDRLKNGLRAFAKSLSSDQRNQILKGEIEVTIPTSELPPVGRQFVHNQLSADRRLNPEYKIPEPKSIKFYVDKIDGLKFTPSLYIGFEENGGYSGYGYLGGTLFENKWQEDLFNRWIHPGDVVKDGPDTIVNGTIEKDSPAAISYLSDKLVEISKKHNKSIICCVPDDESGLNAKLGKNLSTYLQELQDRQPRIWHKYYKGIILLTSISKLTEKEDSRIPSEIRAEIASVLQKRDGFFTLNDIVSIGSTLNPSQLVRLSRQYPVFEQIARWNELFKWINKYDKSLDKITSPRGVSLNDVAAALEKQGIDVSDAIKNGATRLRMTSEDSDTGENKETHRSIDIFLIANDGHLVTRTGFFFTKYADINK